ncbi:Aste57867_23582 [Aphanomyces stellatus]|uniref:Aste57867_23582 protein n=1 Tax=Aphanomyces stellatus TaxID=120398 RepID=A0A485LNA0_9STRA|nr:hypothetical protein As57867_023511 [Aphanomyces stellatus]VFU00227.1 Aste57867_23582 [Aphanomyces stellatus]
MRLLVYTHSLEMLLSDAVVQKRYGRPTSAIDTSPSYPRQLLLGPAIPLKAVVSAIRNIEIAESVSIFTQYCWVDFNRTFELAHTAMRQHRCNSQYRHNAAMYLEPLFRNVVDAHAINASAFASMFEASIFNALKATPIGVEWLGYIYALQMPSVADEVAYWQAQGIIHYIAQLQNLYQHAIHDSITITNAFGMQQNIQIQQLLHVGRGLTQWTTALAHIGFWNDLTACDQIGCSLVRSAPNSMDAFGIDYDVGIVRGPVFTPVTELVVANIGPFGSIDIFLVPIPVELATYYASFQVALFALLQTASQSSRYDQLSEPLVDPVPAPWIGYNYLGGNPMCISNTPRPYIQPMFGYYDACQTQPRDAIQLRRNSLLFALGVSGSGVLPCSICLTTSDACTLAVQTALQLAMPPIATTTAILPLVAALNISIIQFALQNTTNTLLSQAVVGPPSDPYSLFGWITIYEWLQGQREVYSFQGDAATIALMTQLHPSQPHQANQLELPRQACLYVWFISVYATLALNFVALVLWFYGLRSHLGHCNLFYFNRVTGSVWLGRPMLFLRGMTALLLLSTSPVDFITQPNGLTSFRFTPRPFYMAMLVAGEATWIVYVLNDLLLPVSNQHAKRLALFSTIFIWLVFFIVEMAAPVEASLTLHRLCTIQQLSYGIDCTSGGVQIGSSTRLCVLSCVIGGVVCLVYSFGRLLATRCRMTSQTTPAHLILPAAAVHYFTNASSESNQWHLDTMSCVMAGMLPLQNRLFDIKLWLYFVSIRSDAGKYIFKDATFKSSAGIKSFHSMTMTAITNSDGKKYNKIRLRAIFGFAYVVLTVVSSYSYLVLTKSAFSNDFLWASFNASGALTYLSNWYNLNLQVLTHQTGLQLTTPNYGDWSNLYNASVTTFSIAPLYASRVQNEANSIGSVIQGLRQMDGCQLPWIFTPYCFADFTRQWEMAVTPARQRRCSGEVQNGAVYIEAILRNVQWPQFMSCWGTSLETGLFSHLRTSIQGQSWLQAVQSQSTSVRDEVLFWQQHNIIAYITQWQNYKTLGVVETYAIQNSVGISYPLTIKSSNGSFQLAVETTFKMYWSFASDLWAVTSNASGVGGASLIRQSSHFAYSNTSLENVYLQNSSTIIDAGFVSLRSILGPFGSIDMKRVAPIQSLLQAYTTARELLKSIVTSNVTAQKDLRLANIRSFSPYPNAWRHLAPVAGNILCPLPPTVGFSSYNLFSLFTYEGSCAHGASDKLMTTPLGSHTARLLLAPSNLTAQSICQREVQQPLQCARTLNATAAFIQTYISASQRSTIATLAQQVKANLQSSIDIHISQYMLENQSVVLGHASLMDPMDLQYEYFGWLYLFDWISGVREVVTFQGDVGSLTLLTGFTPMLIGTVNGMEIPVNASFYIRSFIQYVTFVLFCVACFVGCIILSSRGYVEGSNMFIFNRVAGLVWVGRPLILLRGLAGLAPLSPPRLLLSLPGDAYVFDEAPQYWLTTIVSAGELTWLVYIINDTLSVFTEHFTPGYATKSSILVWAASAAWTFSVPSTHVATIVRTCEVPAVDFQIVCHSGTLQIGSYSRFGSLIALAGGVTCLCYLIEKLVYPMAKGTNDSKEEMDGKQPSFFLYSAANHAFAKANWVHDDIYYLDKASAVIAGIVAYETHDRILMLDIKMWRTYAVELAGRRRTQSDLGMHPSTLHAIPILE